MEAITPEQIRWRVSDFWDAFTHKAKSQFQELYSPTANCFGADGRHNERARLMWVRREREFFGPRSSVGAKVGVVTVQLLTPSLAVASYPFHFTVVRTLPNGNRVESDMPFARLTQVFQREVSGNLVIIHEHMSSAEPVTPRQLYGQ